MADLQPLLAFALPPLILLCVYVVLLGRKHRVAPYPPGPAPKPIIGNALDIPFSQRPWLKYCDWSKRLNSDIIHMSALNTHIVVLHQLEDVVALLDKKSAIYSDRPYIPIAEPLGIESVTSVLRYGERWQKHRRIFQESVRKDHIPAYYHVQTEKVHLLLGEFLRAPANFSEHCKWLAASFTLASAYGYNIMPGQTHYDHLIQAAEFAVITASELVLPGRTLVNVLPFLRHIPTWVPGASTQRLAAKAKKMWVLYNTEPFEYVKRNLARGTLQDCVLTRLFEHRDDTHVDIYDDHSLQEALGTMYLAGVDTLQSTQTIFILCMALHPECQRKAQKEIDTVVGNEKLPAFKDRASLPYVDALYREVRRWRPILPLGFAHSSTRDDVHKGFYIPKGAILMPNVWAISRDESVYKDPECFIPERFLNIDGTLNDDTVGYTFGFGRRICPGRHLADALIWLMMVCVLATFDIAKSKDDTGAEIEIDPNAFADSIVTYPLPFPCSITPRSSQAECLIRTAASKVSDESMDV